MGTPAKRRSAASTAPITVGSVLSRMGSTTRKRDQASQTQNSWVGTPATGGPSPKSYCTHIPGSGSHGRCTRVRPARQLARTPATARRVVRADP